MATRRRGPPPLRPARPREDERRQLASRWEENRKRREAGWPAAPDDFELRQKIALSRTVTFDAERNQVIKQLRGGKALAAIQADDDHVAELRAKVQNWNRKPSKDGKDEPAKDISGVDVMEALALAFALTNNPAYKAAGDAMKLHRLDDRGLRQPFKNLQRRHGHDQVPTLYAPEVHDTVQEYMDEFGYEFRQAIDHIVADFGMPGASFKSAVDEARKAYAKAGGPLGKRPKKNAVDDTKPEAKSGGPRAPTNSR
jgi:hypothetical protein